MNEVKMPVLHRPFARPNHHFAALASAAIIATLLSLHTSHYVMAASPISIPVVNASFESPNVGNGVGVPDNWTFLPGTGIFVESSAQAGLASGAFLGLQHATFHQVGYIYQELTTDWRPNASYEVRLAAAHRAGFGHGRVEFGLWDEGAIGVDLAPPGYIDVQELFQGPGNPNTILNTFVEPDDPRLNVPVNIGLLDRGRVFTYQTTSAPPTGNLVAFVRFSTGGGRVHFDNFRVMATPEPSGMGLSLWTIALVLRPGGLPSTRRRRATAFC
jgi:hypothetical protein